jgi:hypothetical protein
MGIALGCMVGIGMSVGCIVDMGIALGCMVGIGMSVGRIVGMGIALGCMVGIGMLVGCSVDMGISVGCMVGMADGIMVGMLDGPIEGISVGMGGVLWPDIWPRNCAGSVRPISVSARARSRCCPACSRLESLGAMLRAWASAALCASTISRICSREG